MLKFIILVVFIVTAAVTSDTSGSFKPIPLSKTYAIFSASFNDTQAIGGVAGTAFFISESRAITAYHVLQPKMFLPQPGFDHVKVWMVHEGEPAIQLELKDLIFNSEKDQTEINIKETVGSEYIFEIAKQIKAETPITAEGFFANSVGPVFSIVNHDLKILSVPKLSRYTLAGTILDRVLVTLKADDISLNEIPCYKLSYAPTVGFSGGPVVVDGKVFAMNSFAEPATRKSTFAVILN